MSDTYSQSDRSFMRRFAIMIALLALCSLLLLLVASLTYHYGVNNPGPEKSAAATSRIAPAGAVFAGDTGRAALAEAAAAEAPAEAAYGGTTDGKEVFDHLCASCHGTGIAGAPKVGDTADWAPRIAAGIDTLVHHAIEGYTGPDGFYMPPRGGNPALTDEQVENAVHWIVDQSK